MSSSINFQPLLGPVIALASWTLVMQGWMYAFRIPALLKYKVDTTPEMTNAEMIAKFPRPVQWPADNYNHLMEQPTQFFATVLALNALGAEDRLTVGLAWAYVGLRVLHSLVQAISNVVVVRFGLFTTSSAMLAGLTIKAALLIWGGTTSAGHLEL